MRMDLHLLTYVVVSILLKIVMNFSVISSKIKKYRRMVFTLSESINKTHGNMSSLMILFLALREEKD